MELSPWKQLLLARVLSWLHHPVADTHFPETLGSRPQPRSAPADSSCPQACEGGEPSPQPPGPTDAWIPPQIRAGGRTCSDVPAASRGSPPRCWSRLLGSLPVARTLPAPPTPARCVHRDLLEQKQGRHSPVRCQGPWGSPGLPDECQRVSVLTGVPQGPNREGTVACQGRANGPKQNRFLERFPDVAQALASVRTRRGREPLAGGQSSSALPSGVWRV